MTDQEKLAESLEALQQANDRIGVIGDSLIASINEATAAKAENRRLARVIQALQAQLAANKKDPE